MISGILIENQHSYYRYGLSLLDRDIGEPPKDDHTDRVPYSNITHDFDEITGKSSYGERVLTYRFEFLCLSPQKAQNQILYIKKWLHWTGRKNLYDTALPDYYFEVREPVLEIRQSHHGVYSIKAVFKASPAMQPVTRKAYAVSECRFPDIDGSGTISANDAALVLAAAARIGAGEESGLTEEQEYLADADMDGTITATDAALIQKFAALAGAGKYENSPEGWAEFLNLKLGRKEEIY